MSKESALEKQIDLNRARSLASFMDSSIRFPGTGFHFGLDPLLGLIPGLGDFLSSAFGMYPISLAIKYRLSKWVVWRMIFNLGVDYLLGSVPVLGDVFDAFYKAHNRNVRLLERGLNNPIKSKRYSALFLVTVILALILLLISPIILLAYVLSLLL